MTNNNETSWYFICQTETLSLVFTQSWVRVDAWPLAGSGAYSMLDKRHQGLHLCPHHHPTFSSTSVMAVHEVTLRSRDERWSRPQLTYHVWRKGKAYDNNYTADHCTVEQSRREQLLPPSEASSVAVFSAAWLLPRVEPKVQPHLHQFCWLIAGNAALPRGSLNR